MRRIILKSFQSPGDIVMLTAAVRDLHAAAPGQFQTDVRTSCDDLWQHNPHLTRLSETEPGVETLDMHYPLVHQSNQRPYHFLHGYVQHLEERLGLRIPVTRFHGDLHLTDAEKNVPLPAEWTLPERFWIVIAGGKYDFTAKWWNPASYQQVVDHFRGKIRFVQCGEEGHWHPPLNGVVNLVGKTSLREFVRLMHHADGVLCPVTLAMHLAAAVETKPGLPKHRPCVVVAGGREPPHWEAYPQHQFLSTVGALSCCADGGCWRSRCQLVGDGDDKDRRNVCEQPVEIAADLQIPRCMHLITPEDVVRRIELYYAGGVFLNGNGRSTSSEVAMATTSKAPAATVTTKASKVPPASKAAVNPPAPQVFLPYRGEFGHKIMWHVPWVHSQPGPKIVCCEPGEEALFPGAERCVIVDRKKDGDRREWKKYDEQFLSALRKEYGALGKLIDPLDKLPGGRLARLKRFIPQPHRKQGIECDVVVCPRNRAYGSNKNWPRWPELVQMLAGRYAVFAAGAPDSSFDVPCEKAWDHERYLDATIEAMLSAKVVVATDAGLAHLAILCGRPLVLIAHGEGDTAPGYGRIKLARYQEANHRRAPIKIVKHGWDRLDHVLRWTAELAGETADNYHYWAHRYRKLGDARTVCNCRGGDVDARTRATGREFERLLPPRSAKLLDFGCGPGRLAPALQRLCDEYYGTDLVPEVLQRADSGGGTFAPLVRGRIPFEGVRFDTIVTVTVLQHMVNEDLFLQTLDQFSSRMRSGGTLLLHENVAARPNSGHMRFRSVAEYVNRLYGAGFDVVQVSAVGDDFPPERFSRVDELARDQHRETHAFFKAIRV